MPADELDLVGLRRPCYVTIPLTGRRVAVRFFRAEQKQLYNKWMAEPNNAAPLLELLRFAVPDITDDELNDLDIEQDIPQIIMKANGKAAALELALKNGVSDGASQVPSPTRRSAPTTKSRTTSAASPKRSSSGRGNSSKSSGTKSSLPTTG